MEETKTSLWFEWSQSIRGKKLVLMNGLDNFFKHLADDQFMMNWKMQPLWGILITQPWKLRFSAQPGQWGRGKNPRNLSYQPLLFPTTEKMKTVLQPSLMVGVGGGAGRVGWLLVIKWYISNICRRSKVLLIDAFCQDIFLAKVAGYQHLAASAYVALMLVSCGDFSMKKSTKCLFGNFCF